MQSLSQFMEFIYENFDAFKLIVCCSEGTRHQGYVDNLVDLAVGQSALYFGRLREIGKLEGEVSPEVHHMLTSAYFNAVLETVAHDMDKMRALSYIEEISRFFTSGWNSILKFL
jgi:hypothetical protein